MENKCLKPNCNGAIKSRGLCSDCYSAAVGLVKAKKTSWSKLEAKGKSLPKFFNRKTGKNSRYGERAIWFLSDEDNEKHQSI